MSTIRLTMAQALVRFLAAQGTVVEVREDCGSSGVAFAMADAVVVTGNGLYDVPSLVVSRVSHCDVTRL